MSFAPPPPFLREHLERICRAAERLLHFFRDGPEAERDRARPHGLNQMFYESKLWELLQEINPERSAFGYLGLACRVARDWPSVPVEITGGLTQLTCKVLFLLERWGLEWLPVADKEHLSKGRYERTKDGQIIDLFPDLPEREGPDEDGSGPRDFTLWASAPYEVHPHDIGALADAIGLIRQGLDGLDRVPAANPPEEQSTEGWVRDPGLDQARGGGPLPVALPGPVHPCQGAATPGACDAHSDDYLLNYYKLFVAQNRAFQGRFPTPTEYRRVKRAAQDFLRTVRLHLPPNEGAEVPGQEWKGLWRGIREAGRLLVFNAALQLDTAIHPPPPPPSEFREIIPYELWAPLKCIILSFFILLIRWEWRGSWDYISPEEARENPLAPLPMIARGVPHDLFLNFERGVSLLVSLDVPPGMSDCSCGCEDYYREPANTQPTSSDHAASEQGAAPPLTLILNGPTDGPIVRGKRKPRLTPGQYRLVKALLDAHPERLSKDELANRAQMDGPVHAIDRLRRDEDWAAVLDKPGKSHGGYGLRIETDRKG